MIDYRVYLVTDDPSRYAGDWLANVEAAVAGGVTCVQYRDEQSNGRTKYERARALKDVLARTHTPLVVNNDAALALAVGAEGVHVGQRDLPPPVVRRLVGPQVEIGFSLTNLDEARAFRARCAADEAWRTAVDCVGIGPVYDATKTKADAAPEMGLTGLKEVLDEIADLPNVAIGGITPERAAGIVRAGAGGLAVVSAFSQSPDPASIARTFRSLF